MSRDDLQPRVPPHSVEAEQAVLGGLMLLDRAWFDVCDVLTEDDFYRRDHALIWRAIRWMAEKQKPFDTVTLGDWLEAQGFAEVVPLEYLIELSTTTPSAASRSPGQSATVVFCALSALLSAVWPHW